MLHSYYQSRGLLHTHLQQRPAHLSAQTIGYLE